MPRGMRLHDAGQPLKLVITATARKRLSVLKAMLASNTDDRQIAFA